ncbi:unnamed protein product [Blepharisma stoltei]|uniref:Glutathione S-transferase n=1 Tax=Blepharisma stoltei TaxID=1481888 RepID=A0AAU9KDG9_9CILI|nr:unnamed protein product [Blepharisma stoltei]
MEGEITLHYFNIYGTAEPIRMIFHYFNIPFRDNQISFQDWSHLKHNSFVRIGKLPVLEIDNENYSECYSILGYLANEIGIMPDDWMEKYLVDSICEFIIGVNKNFTKLAIKNDLENKERIIHEIVPKWLRRFEARLSKNNEGKDCFVGKRLTVADFIVFQFMWDYFLKPGKAEIYRLMVEQCAPTLMEWTYRFLDSSPELISYIESRDQFIF